MATNADTEKRKLDLAEVTGAWQACLFVGIITLVFGLVIAFHPSTSFNVICILIGIAVLIAGIFRVIRSLDADEHDRALQAVIGVVTIVIGLILIRHLDLSRVIVAFIVGIVFVVQGVAELVVGFRVDASAGRRIWRVVAGLISIVAGIVVMAVPEHSVDFLAALLGIWIAIMGGLLVVEGFVIRHAAKEVHAA